MTDYVDLGHGRGWASRDAAASIRRIDAVLGHPLQITESGRSAEQADANYRAYQAYLAGAGPWAPLAYDSKNSVHCWGNAIDTNEGQQHLELLKEHGWIRTVYRGGVLIEPWHFEYSTARDAHYTETTTEGEDDMFTDDDRAKLDAAYAALCRDGKERADWSIAHKVDWLVRQVDAIVSGVDWIKQRIGGSLKNGAKSLTALIGGIK